MLKLINEKIRTQFPLFLHFQDKVASIDKYAKIYYNYYHSHTMSSNNLLKLVAKLLGKFWLQEFLDKEGNSIKKINMEEIFKSRSNIEEMQNFASSLVAKINREYRNSFQIIPKLLIEDNGGGLPAKRLRLVFLYMMRLF